MTATEGTRTFRSSIQIVVVRLSPPYIGSGLLGALAMLCRIGFPSAPAAWMWIVVLAMTVGFVGALLTSLFTQAYPLSVSAEGVRGYNFWGVYSMVPCGDMTRATPFNLMGLKCVRVMFTGGRLPLWIPLFLSKQAEFNSAVQELAPPGNPLRDFLQVPWTPEAEWAGGSSKNAPGQTSTHR